MISDKIARQHIGENVRRLLAEHDPPWKQADLARASGENEMRISGLVRGTQTPSAPFLARIAEAFGVSVDYLIFAPAKRPSDS